MPYCDPMPLLDFWDGELEGEDESVKLCNLIALHEHVGAQIPTAWRVPFVLFHREMGAGSLKGRCDISDDVGAVAVTPKEGNVDDVSLHTMIARCAIYARHSVRTVELRLLGSTLVRVTPA